MRRLKFFKKKKLDKSESLSNFADEYDEPTALAYTDFTKPMPVLEGEDAERFVRIMEENEKKAKERAKLPPTKEEIDRELRYSKIMYDFNKRQLEELEERIKELEKLHAEIEEK